MKHITTILLTAALLCGCSQNTAPTPPPGLPTPPPPPPRVSVDWVGDMPGAHIYILTDSVEGGQYLAVVRRDYRAGVAIQPLIKKP